MVCTLVLFVHQKIKGAAYKSGVDGTCKRSLTTAWNLYNERVYSSKEICLMYTNTVKQFTILKCLNLFSKTKRASLKED